MVSKDNSVSGSPQPALSVKAFKDPVPMEKTTSPTIEHKQRLTISNLNFYYGPKQAVFGLNLKIPTNRVTALIGPSGCGKSTFLRTLNRMNETIRNTRVEGEVLLDGQDIHELEVNALRRRVTMVFQQPNPFPMTIFENVAYALREAPGGHRRGRRAQLEPDVRDALRRAGLHDEVGEDLDRSAMALSGGQQQRLCIARALAAEPEVLLLDEPCSALDPISTAVIEELIIGLRESVAVVIVTHNLQQAFRVADHVAFMHLGELVEYGSAEQVFDRPSQQRTRDYISGAFG